MTKHSWVAEFPAAVTVCDEQGVIIEMNARAAEVFAQEGGEALIGSNVLDCHPEPSRSLLAALLREKKSNAYTIEKKGLKKLIYQSPWYEQGVFAGLVEISLEIPESMPHFHRA